MPPIDCTTKIGLTKRIPKYSGNAVTRITTAITTLLKYGWKALFGQLKTQKTIGDIEREMAGLAPEVRHKIVCDNARRLYAFG